jgi:hypothetical protein
VTAPVGPLGNGEVDRQRRDQEQSASVLCKRIRRQPADVVEAAAAIHDVQHAVGTAVIDRYFDLVDLRVTHDVADEFAEDELRVRARVGTEAVPFERFDEQRSRGGGSAAVAHVESATLDGAFSFAAVGPHDEQRDVVRRSVGDHALPDRVGRMARGNRHERSRGLAQRAVSRDDVAARFGKAVGVEHEHVALRDRDAARLTALTLAQADEQ